MVLKLCFKDYVQMVDKTLAGQAVLEGTGRILFVKLSAEVAALPQLFPLSNIKIILNSNIYELLIYKMRSEAAILKSCTNTDFQDWVYRARISIEKAAGTDSNDACHVDHLESQHQFTVKTFVCYFEIILLLLYI